MNYNNIQCPVPQWGAIYYTVDWNFHNFFACGGSHHLIVWFSTSPPLQADVLPFHVTSFTSKLLVGPCCLESIVAGCSDQSSYLILELVHVYRGAGDAVNAFDGIHPLSFFLFSSLVPAPLLTLCPHLPPPIYLILSTPHLPLTLTIECRIRYWFFFCSCPYK